MTFLTITSPVRFSPPPQRALGQIILTVLLLAIERIEERRESNPEMDAVYFLSPEPQIVDCLLADFEMRRYRKSFIVWLSLPEPSLRRRVDDYPAIRQLRASSKTLNVDFYSRESHLVVLRDPWSFPMLYHPACNSLVANHMMILAKRVSTLLVEDFPPSLEALEANDRPDCRYLHHPRRHAQDPILQASRCYTRGKRFVYSSGQVCSGRAGPLRLPY